MPCRMNPACGKFDRHENADQFGFNELRIVSGDSATSLSCQIRRCVHEVFGASAFGCTGSLRSTLPGTKGSSRCFRLKVQRFGHSLGSSWKDFRECSHALDGFHKSTFSPIWRTLLRSS